MSSKIVLCAACGMRRVPPGNDYKEDDISQFAVDSVEALNFQIIDLDKARAKLVGICIVGITHNPHTIP